mmetsp:Transcript_7538/g.10817  ORF Transcript_7538/g.10817 Transcript_7538/m.10817 type:complete len:671 (-) Transcript_7538:105-2117(-)
MLPLNFSSDLLTPRTATITKTNMDTCEEHGNSSNITNNNNNTILDENTASAAASFSKRINGASAGRRRLSGLDLFQSTFGDEPASSSSNNVTASATDDNSNNNKDPQDNDTMEDLNMTLPQSKLLQGRRRAPRMALSTTANAAAAAAQVAASSDDHNKTSQRTPPHNNDDGDESDDDSLNEDDLNAIYAAAARMPGPNNGREAQQQQQQKTTNDDTKSSNQHTKNNKRQRMSHRSSFAEFVTSGMQIPSFLQSYVERTRRSFRETRRSVSEVVRRSSQASQASQQTIGTIDSVTNQNQNGGRRRSSVALFGAFLDSASSQQQQQPEQQHPPDTIESSTTACPSSKRRFSELFLGLQNTAKVNDTNDNNRDKRQRRPSRRTSFSDFLFGTSNRNNATTEPNTTQKTTTTKKRNWWNITPSSIMEDASPNLHKHSNSHTNNNNLMGSASQNHNSTEAGDNNNSGTSSSSRLVESLLHQSCRLYAQTAPVVASAIKVDLQAVRRRWISPQQLKRRQLKDFSYPVNIALYNGASVEVLELLVNAAPEILGEQDGPEGCSSISLLLQRGQELYQKDDLMKIMNLMLSRNPLCTQLLDKRSNYPLHVACSKGYPLRVIERLVSAYPKAMESKNFHGQTPLEVSQKIGLGNDDVTDYLQHQMYEILEQEADHLEDLP